jgi:hypothetical protein
MSRSASRISIEVVDYTVERIQKISTDDVFAEGFQVPVSSDCSHTLLRLTGKFPPSDYLKKDYTPADFIRAHFASGWDLINSGRGFGWNTDCYVWVYTIKRIR